MIPLIVQMIDFIPPFKFVPILPAFKDSNPVFPLTVFYYTRTFIYSFNLIINDT